MSRKNAEVILWVRVTQATAKRLDAIVSKEQKKRSDDLVKVSRSSLAREGISMLLDAKEAEEDGGRRS